MTVKKNPITIIAYRLLRIVYCLLPIAYCLFIMGCGKKNIRDYYFPLTQLREKPMVYEYEFKTRDTSLRLYSYFQTIVQGDSVSFVGTDYDPDFQVMMMRREQMLSNGMKLKDLRYYGSDSTGKAIEMKAAVTGGAVFPFEVKDSNGVFINIIKYKDPKDSTHETTLTRNFRFLRTTVYDYKNQKYDAVEFEKKDEQAEHDLKQGGWQHVYKVTEIYAKGLGLVYSKRYVTDVDVIEIRLVDVYSMEDLEKKFKTHLEGVVK
jgi:hypothetical protein